VLLLVILLNISVFAQSDYPVIKISDDIELLKISEKVYVHVSAAEIEGFGRVYSNGLLLADNGEAFLFDTPVSNEQTQVLYDWITDSMNISVTGFIAGHWHSDCMGGLEYLDKKNIKSYANEMTIDIAREKRLPQPRYGFKDSLSLKLNNIDVICYYPGAGHSLDNIVMYIPSEKILFGGCLVKDIHSTGLGNVADGNVSEWSASINNVIE